MPVPDLEAGADFHASLLGLGGKRVSTDRHYFPCDSMILAVVTPAADGCPYKANPEITYIAVDNVEVSLDLARSISGVEVESEVELPAWG